MKNTVRLAAAVMLVTAMVNLGHAADTPEPVVLKGHTKSVSTVAWSADGKVVATASDDRTIRIWDPVTGRQTASLPEIAREGFGGPVVAFTADLEVAAINYWGKVTVRRVADGKVLATIDPIPDVPGQKSAFRPDVFAMSISPDGKQLATAGSVGVVGGRHGLPGGCVVVWDVETGTSVHQSDALSTSASCIVWNSDGSRFAAGTSGAGGELPEPGEVWVWDAKTGEVVHSFKVVPEVEPGAWASARDIAFSPDGKRVVVSVTAGSRGKPAGLLVNDNSALVQVWDLPTGDSTQLLKGLKTSISHVAFSPDGKSLATADSDKAIRLWDLETKEELATFKCPDRITAVVFSPDGKSLAAGSNDGTVHIWSVPESD